MSPGKKSRQNADQQEQGSDDKPASEAFLLAMEKRMMDRFEARIDGVESKVAENANQIGKLQRQDKLLEDRVTALAKKVDDGASSSSVKSAAINSRNEEEFHLCRRSLFIWPVKGPEDLKEYMKGKLKITEPEIRDMGKIEVRRNKESNAKQGEVCVIFPAKWSRDVVKKAGVHLADDSTSGIRIKIPGYLLDDFRALESVAYHMKQADQSVRRAVKFDDSTHGLFMDVKVGETWKRVSPEEARRVIDNNPDIQSKPPTMEKDEISKIIAGKK